MRIYFLIILIVAFSSCNKIYDEEFTIVKNCTGIYLVASSDKEYRVCNEKLLYDYKSSDKVNVKYYFVEHDKICEGIHCEMLYPFDETIVVRKIK